MKEQVLGQSEVKISPIIMGMSRSTSTVRRKYAYHFSRLQMMIVSRFIMVGLFPPYCTRTNFDKLEIVKSVRAGFDAGITTFDTAELYFTEQVLGEALSDVRESVVYATKVSPENLNYHQLIKSCESSLQNLNTDYIDIYQIHFPSGFFTSGRTWRKIIPIEETMSALNKLKEQGKIRAIGICNFSLLQLQEARKWRMRYLFSRGSVNKLRLVPLL